MADLRMPSSGKDRTATTMAAACPDAVSVPAMFSNSKQATDVPSPQSVPTTKLTSNLKQTAIAQTHVSTGTDNRTTHTSTTDPTSSKPPASEAETVVLPITKSNCDAPIMSAPIKLSTAQPAASKTACTSITAPAGGLPATPLVEDGTRLWKKIFTATQNCASNNDASDQQPVRKTTLTISTSEPLNPNTPANNVAQPTTSSGKQIGTAQLSTSSQHLGSKTATTRTPHAATVPMKPATSPPRATSVPVNPSAAAVPQRVSATPNVNSTHNVGSSAMHAAKFNTPVLPSPTPTTAQARAEQTNATSNAMITNAQNGMPAGRAQAVVTRNNDSDMDFAQVIRNFSRPLQTLRKNVDAHLPSRRYGTGVVRMVDYTRLDGRHMWITLPVSDMSFNRFVLENSCALPDMQRFQQFISQCGRQDAINLWAKYTESHPWFSIPLTIRTTRTFARDELEVLYVDCMDRLTACATMFDGSVSLKMEMLPLLLLGDPLVSRWWNQPKAAAGILREQEIWHHQGIMYPFDSLDLFLVGENLDRLRELYPPPPVWWTIEWFPAGVPCPSPPCIFYFPERIRSALFNVNSSEHSAWQTVLQLEYAALYAATWWHEAARGHRGVIVPEETVAWLEERLGNVAIDPDTPHGPTGHTTFEWIASRMRQVRAVPQRYANRLCFPGSHLPPSYFVWTGYATAFPNLNEAGGRLFARGSQSGKMYEQGVHPNRYGSQPRINRRQPQPVSLNNVNASLRVCGEGGYRQRDDGREDWPSHGANNYWSEHGRDDRGYSGRDERDNWNREHHIGTEEYEDQHRASRRRALNDRSVMGIPNNFREDRGRREDDYGGRHFYDGRENNEWEFERNRSRFGREHENLHYNAEQRFVSPHGRGRPPRMDNGWVERRGIGQDPYAVERGDPYAVRRGSCSERELGTGGRRHYDDDGYGGRRSGGHGTGGADYYSGFPGCG